MALEAVKALRDALKNDPALTAFWLEKYAKAATYKIGYKRSANANDFPSVSLEPATGEYDGIEGNQDVISITLGVNDATEVDGVVGGFERLDEAKTLALAALRPLIVGKARIIWDTSERRPFFEVSLLVRVRYREPSKLAKRNYGRSTI